MRVLGLGLTDQWGVWLDLEDGDGDMAAARERRGCW